MEKHGADRTAAEGELFIGVAAAIIDIKFCGVPVGSGGILQHFLEVIGVIIIKKSPANQQTGMVINDHDAVYPPAAAVFCYVRQVTGICLPHPAKGIFLKSFPVSYVRVARRYEVMLFDKPLDRTDAYCCREEILRHKMPVDLGGIECRECFLKAEYLLYGGVRKRLGGTLVRLFLRHEGFDTAILVKGPPFADRFGNVLEDRAVRQGERFFGDALVISFHEQQINRNLKRTGFSGPICWYPYP